MILFFVTPCFAAGTLPYAVEYAGEGQIFELRDQDRLYGHASLCWTQQHLILKVAIHDQTPITISDINVGPDTAYKADSVEFWLGRHQFNIAYDGKTAGVWDCLYSYRLPKTTVQYQQSESGYQFKASIPWGELGIQPQTGLTLPFLMQVNNRLNMQEDLRWKEKVRQIHFPTTATWDRVSTYGLIFLSDGKQTNTASQPLSFATLDIKPFAYQKKVHAVIKPLAPFGDMPMVLVIRDAQNQVVSELNLPGLSAESVAGLHVDLPWMDEKTGIFQAQLYIVDQNKRYGPVTEPYFNAGPVPIAKHQSDRQAPDDLQSFWDSKIAVMRKRPMNANITLVPSTKAGVICEKVSLENHRGNPMIVWVSRYADEPNPMPAQLNVYPPMRHVSPINPRRGSIGMTYCGSLQEACRLPGQIENESLWARAESLDDCYWLDVVLDGVRAMDYVATRSQSNGKVIVSGGSRGGWYSMALAAVAPDRVTLARFTSPCYSDVTMNMQLGYSSAAMEIYSNFERDRVLTHGKIFANFRYFDPLFLAQMIRTPVVYSAGLQDHICSAIGMTAAANRIVKPYCTFILDPQGGHGGSPWMGPINSQYENSVLP